MPKRLCRCALLLWLPLLAFRMQAADVPPPLAFSHYYTDETEYYVMDFATGDVTTIARTGSSQPENAFVGETVTPDEVLLPSPVEVGVQMQFVNETGLWMENGGYYTLYQRQTTGAPVFVADHTIRISPLDWSNDGRFFYFVGEQTTEGLSTLYQYEIETRTLTTLLSDVFYAPSTECEPRNQWCALRVTSQRSNDDTGRYSLYLLEMRTGSLRFIGLTGGAFKWVWWHSDTFLYVRLLAQARTELRLYDYSTHTDSLFVELSGTFTLHYVYDVRWSPNEDWLALAANGAVFAVDLRQAEHEAHLLSANLPAETPDPSSIRWVTENTLFFQGYVREDTEDTAAGHYYVVVTFPDVTVRTAAALPIIGNLFDQAWSPDNRWMAITFSNTLYVIDILGTTPARQMTMDGLETDVMCIGWYPPEVYASGQAYLCNVYMGIG